MTNPETVARRDQIRRALAEADGFAFAGLEPHDYQQHADAIVALFEPELLRAQAEVHQYRTALQGVARRAAVSVPPPVPQAADRAAVSATLWAVAEHHTIAEWICCDPINPSHDLCVQGGMALEMLRALLVDDPEAAGPAPLLDAVLAVLPDPTDRAAILTEAADRMSRRAAELTEGLDDFAIFVGKARAAEAEILNREADELRRLAAEAPTTTKPDAEAHPPHHRWMVETRDNLAEEWAPGTRFTDRAEAAARYQTVSELYPEWRDGTPVQRRVVRETTTYTVEPAAGVRQDGAQPQ